MGENGHNFVKENLTWDKVVNKYIEAYQSMIDAEN